MKSLTEDQKVFIATIASEGAVTALGEPVSSVSRQAMANVVMNRASSSGWTVAAICAEPNQFSGYGDENYQTCMAYLNARNGGNAIYEAIIWD